MTQIYPESIENPIQALRLVQKANKEKKKYCLYKERALKKLEKAIANVDMADRRLHKAEICRGRLFDIIRTSGYQIPTVVPSLLQSLVYVAPDEGA